MISFWSHDCALKPFVDGYEIQTEVIIREVKGRKVMVIDTISVLLISIKISYGKFVK